MTTEEKRAVTAVNRTIRTLTKRLSSTKPRDVAQRQETGELLDAARVRRDHLLAPYR